MDPEVANALSSLDSALLGMGKDVGQELLKELLLKEKLCSVFSDPGFKDFLEVN